MVFGALNIIEQIVPYIWIDEMLVSYFCVYKSNDCNANDIWRFRDYMYIDREYKQNIQNASKSSEMAEHSKKLDYMPAKCRNFTIHFAIYVRIG